MNGSSRHTHHKHQPRPSQRRRLRRRQQVTVILAVIGITLLVLATVFLIIGARMHKKSAALRESDTATEPPVEAPETPEVPSILAYPLERNSPSQSLASLKKQGKSAATLALTDANGAPMYNDSTVAAIVSDAKENGIYLSGVYSLSSLSLTDDLSRFRALSDDCLTLAEMLRAGLDEVILIPPSLTEQNREELLELLRDLRRLVPNAKVGLALPHEFLASAIDATEEDSALLDALSEQFTLLAVDLTHADDIDAAVEADLYHLLRYSMRVLLPVGSGESQISVVKAHGIENIQILS